MADHPQKSSHISSHTFIEDVRLQKVIGGHKVTWDKRAKSDDHFEGMRWMGHGEEFFEEEEPALSRWRELSTAGNNLNFFDADGSSKIKG